MKRLVSLIVGSLIVVPALALAQSRPLPPPPPPAPPAPVAPAVPPTPPAPPAPPVPFQYFDRFALDEAVRAAQAVHINADVMREQAHLAAEQARVVADVAWRQDALHWGQQNLFVTYNSNESGNYNGGLSLMDQRKYGEAVARFDRVIVQQGRNVDAALYYKAFCQGKLGQHTEATATLAELKKSHAQSPYLKDARALEMEVRNLGPNQVDDEELKILALQSLQYQSPEQAIPLLEGVLAKATNSLNYKRRALFVLAQIDQPRARATLLSYAKGSGNPDLQRRAIEYLGQRGQKATAGELIEIYNSTTDVDIRSSVIRAFQSAGAKSPLLAIAGGAPGGPGVPGGGGANAVVSVDGLRRQAIQSLTDLASPQELWPLYQKEENRDLRVQWVGVFSTMGAVDQLLQVVKTEKDPAVKNRAVRALGNLRADKTGAALIEMYATGDRDTKMAVISALSSQNNVDGMIAVFGKETDVTLKRELISKLADHARTSKVAMDFLTNMIK